MSASTEDTQQLPSAPADLGFDPEALRAKYRAERDKRIRTDGNAQYTKAVGDYAHFDDDPYAVRVERQPLTDEVDVVVIGGGFGGLLAGARLREAGVKRVRIIERGGDFGGTWYWNRYPGAQCDVEAYIYLPLLEELGRIPSERYAHQPEIRAHIHAIADRFNLYSNACFHTVVTGVRWDDDIAHWVVTTDRGDAIRARFIVMASGILDRLKIPRLPGVHEFKGHSFHTSRWDYEYTGGDSSGGLHNLADKRVGIIGTGATAAQTIPYLARYAKHLYVFQRTPSSVDVRNNQPTDPTWVAGLTPGWQKRRMENFNTLVSGGFAEEDLVNDAWTDIVQRFLTMFRHEDPDSISAASIEKVMELADFQKMNALRDRITSTVKDPKTAEALKPWYRLFCKRPCFHDEYLDVFNRPNVTLVDTEGKGVERITEHSVIAGSDEYEVDCLVYATGFEFLTDYTQRVGYDLVGRNGVRLSEKWRNGMATLHGIQSNGFPNAFIFSPNQATLTINFTHMLDELATHTAYIVKHAIERNVRTVEPSVEAENSWVETIVNLSTIRQEFWESCTPGYYNAEGNPSERSAREAFYGAGAPAYFDVLKNWRDEGKLEGLLLDSSEAGPAHAI